MPQDLFWLTKYFKTPIRLAFLNYYHCFGTAARFCKHTGFICNIRYIKKMKNQYVFLIESHKQAKKNFDFEKVALIEMGKQKLY